MQRTFGKDTESMLLPIEDEAWYDQVPDLSTRFPRPTWLPIWLGNKFYWETSVYGNVHEDIPKDILAPLGNIVTFSHYVGANLYHDMALGNSVTWILHLVNQTPIEWHSKKQATMETATYGSDFLADRTCVEQLIDLHLTLSYVGIPIQTKSYVFGDNKTEVQSGTLPQSKLHKRHTALSFHQVREAIAAKIIGFYHIRGEIYPADILSKHWGYTRFGLCYNVIVLARWYLINLWQEWGELNYNIHIKRGVTGL